MPPQRLAPRPLRSRVLPFSAAIAHCIASGLPVPAPNRTFAAAPLSSRSYITPDVPPFKCEKVSTCRCVPSTLPPAPFDSSSSHPTPPCPPFLAFSLSFPNSLHTHGSAHCVCHRCQHLTPRKKGRCVQSCGVEVMRWCSESELKGRGRGEKYPDTLPFCDLFSSTKPCGSILGCVCVIVCEGNGNLKVRG